MKTVYDVIYQQLAFAQEGFKLVAGNQTICQLGKQGVQDSLIKQAEGRLQALSDLQRCIKHLTDREIIDCMRQKQQFWLQLPQHEGAWQDYRNAGLAVIDEIFHIIEID